MLQVTNSKEELIDDYNWPHNLSDGGMVYAREKHGYLSNYFDRYNALAGASELSPAERKELTDIENAIESCERLEQFQAELARIAKTDYSK